MAKFNKVYKQYDTFMKLFNLYKIEEITNFLDLKGNEVIGDLGGGTGRLASELSLLCDKIYVIDESEKMLSKVKSDSNIISVNENILNLSLEDNCLDLVILTDVLHHIKEQDKLIKIAYRLLKPEGKLLILDFNRGYMKTKVLHLFESLLFGKLYYKTCGETINMLVRNSFNNIKVNNNSFYYLILGEKHV